MKMEINNNSDKSDNTYYDLTTINELSLEIRINHKNLDIKKSAFLELKSELFKNSKDRDEIVIPFENSILDEILLNSLKDRNNEINQISFDLLIYIFDNLPELLMEYFKLNLFKFIIENIESINSNSNTSNQLILLILENTENLNSLLEILRSNLNSNPNISIINILKFLITEYGCDNFDYKYFMQTLINIIEDEDDILRKHVYEVIQEIYRWKRSMIIPSIRDVENKYLREMRKNFEEIDDNEEERPEAKRMINKYERNKKKKIIIKNLPEVIKIKKEDEKIIEEDEKINEKVENIIDLKLVDDDLTINNKEYFTTPITPLKNLIINEPKKEFYLLETFTEEWVNNLLSKDKKWNDKKEILEEFSNIINNAKILDIIDSKYDTLFSTFKTLLKDSNINVIICSLSSINSLTLQLGQQFTPYVKEYIPIILEKFKEKKDKLNKEIVTTLSNILKCNITLDEFIIYLKSITNDKSNQYKLNICEFLLISMKKTYKNILRKCVRDLFEIFSKLYEEQNTEIRNAASNCLAMLKVRLNDYFMKDDMFSELGEIKKLKIEEFAKNVTYDKLYDIEPILEKVPSPKIKINKRINSNINKVEAFKEKEVDEIVIIKNNNKNNKKNNDDDDDNINKEKINFDDIPISKSAIKIDNVDSNLTNFDENSNKDDISQSTINNKQNDLDDFTRKLEEAMKKESEKKIDTSIIKKPAVKKVLKENNIESKSSKTITNNINNEEDEESSKLNKAEIEDKLNSLIGPEISNLLQSSKWDEKKNGLIMLNEFINREINENSSLISQNLENLIIFIKIKLKDYKETNFNIIREACTVYCTLISNYAGKGFDKRLTSMLIKGLYEKLGEAKLKEHISNLLFTMMENIGPKFVLTNLLKYFNNEKKAPGVSALKEYSILFEKAIEDFGINLIPAKEIVEFCKILSSNTNPQVRNSSTTLLCAMYKYIGAGLKFLLKDIKESTLKVIETEFEKVKIEDANEFIPKRELRAAALKDEGNVIQINSKKNTNNSNNTNILDSLIPRQDISKKITAKLIKEINDGKWPEKKVASEALEKILLDANMKILPNGLTELFAMIKLRLSDSKKNVVRLIVNLLVKIIDSLGSEFKLFTKIISAALLNNLSDKMQMLREDVMVCMDRWVAHCGFETIIIYIPNILKIDNFEMRTELFKFLHKYKESFVFVKDKFDLKEFVSPLLICLQDKSIPIRTAAEELIGYLIKFISINNFLNGLKDFKTAIANTLRLILEKYRNVNDDFSLENPMSQSTQLPMNMTVKNSKSGDLKSNIYNLNQSPTPLKKESKIILKNNSSKKDLDEKTIKNNLTKSNIKIKQFDDLAANSVTIKPTNSKLLSSTVNVINNKKSFILLQNPLIKTTKEKRLEIDKKFKFNLETLNDDFLNKLKEQMRQIFSSEFVDKMFHDDLKYNIESFNLLHTQIKEIESNIFDHSDIILKWIGWKCNNNPNPLLSKVLLEFLETFIDKLTEREIELNDTEGYIIIYLLVDKLGHNNQKVKENVKILIEKYFDKISNKFSLIVNSSVSKNSKVKIESLEICSNLLKGNGINIASKQDLKTIIKMITTTDNLLKNSIVNFFSIVYVQMKDNLWNILNDTSDKIKEMLYNKFYQMGLVEEENNNENNNENEESNNSSQDEIEIKNILVTNNTNSNSPNKINLNSNKNVSDENLFHVKTETKNVTNNLNSYQSTINTNNTINANNTINDKNDLIQILNNLNQGDLSERVNVILIIHELVFTKFAQSKHILIPNIDIIIKSFVFSLKNLFENKNIQEIPIKLGKYLLTVLYKISSNKELIKNISYEVLFELSEEVLSNLLIENLDKVGENQEGVIIIRSLNSTMLRVLENCNYTNVISVLLELVKKYRKVEVKIKISSLAIKCLLKINQILPQIIESIQCDKILIKINELLIELEITNPELVTNNPTDQMVIRYIKNLINEIVKLKKDGIISDYIKGLERPEINDKYLKRWIRNILSSMGAGNKGLDNFVTTNRNNSSPKKVLNIVTSPSSNNNNLESLIAYKNKLQQNYTSSKSPINETKNKQLIPQSSSNSPMKKPRNSEMYNKIINLKSKLAHYNNNTLTSRNEDSKILSRTFIENSSNSPDNSIIMTQTQDEGRPILSKINELKKKWNDVSNKNKTNLNNTVLEDTSDVNKLNEMKNKYNITKLGSNSMRK